MLRLLGEFDADGPLPDTFAAAERAGFPILCDGRAAAASAAVWALSGRMTTSPVPPRRVSSPRNEVMDACSVDMMRA